MSQLEREAHSLAKAKKDAENEAFDNYQKTVEKAKNLWFLIWGLIFATFSGAVWKTTMQFRVNNFDKELISIYSRFERDTISISGRFDKLEAKILSLEGKLDANIRANEISTLGVTTLTNNLQKSVDDNREDIKSILPKVSEMWWMKERGITNKDAPPIKN
mgnify:CR=1 FL=1